MSKPTEQPIEGREYRLFFSEDMQRRDDWEDLWDSLTNEGIFFNTGPIDYSSRLDPTNARLAMSICEGMGYEFTLVDVGRAN